MTSDAPSSSIAMNRSIRAFTLLPVEIVGLGAIMVLLTGSLLMGYRIYLPDTNALVFAAKHYLGPILPIVFLSLFAVLRKPADRQNNAPLATHGIRTLSAFAFIVFIHFNLKLWAQLINPNRYDAVFQQIDLQFGEVVAVLDILGHGFRSALQFLPHAYHEVFVGMFFVSFLVHAVRPPTQVFDELVAAVSLVLLLGGLAYAVAPATGPFIFEPSPEIAAAIQTDMKAFHDRFIASDGADYESRFFVAALAAMPSLHIAHAAVFIYFGFRHTRWLGWIYVLPGIYLAAEAVASNWHYLIDLPAGLLITGLSILIARRMTKVPCALGQTSLSKRTSLQR